MDIAFGHYLNLYDRNGKRDVFIVFNEPNSEPTEDEVDALCDLVKAELGKDPSGATLRDAVENSGLECVDFGVQIKTSGLAHTLENKIYEASKGVVDHKKPSVLSKKNALESIKENFSPATF